MDCTGGKRKGVFFQNRNHSEFSFCAVAGSRTSEFGPILFNFYMCFEV